MTKQTIEGLNLARLRKERGLTQEDLAEQCDMKKAYISQIETGTVGMTDKKRAVFMRVFDVEVKEFYREPGETGKAPSTNDDALLVSLVGELQQIFNKKQTRNEKHRLVAKMLKALSEDDHD